MAEGLRSIDQIGPGFLWNFPRLRDELNWERWYNGRFETMFPPATIDNGLPFWPGMTSSKSTCPGCSRKFYEDAILAEPPVVTGSEAGHWLGWQRTASRSGSASGRGVQQWSIFGLGAYSDQLPRTAA